MKVFFLVLVAVCSCCALDAQDNPYKKFITDRSSPVSIVLSGAGKQKNFRYFKDIEVVDYRPDTARIGLIKKVGTTEVKELILPVPKMVGDFLNGGYADKNGNNSLLVVVNKLWSYNVIMSYSSRQQQGEPVSKLLFRAEAYLKTSDGLMPLTYLDTTAGIKLGSLIGTRIVLQEMITVLMNGVAGIDIAAVTRNRKAISYAQLHALKVPAAHYPIETAEVINKGVYASLDDFRNNKPSIDNYKIEKNKDGEMELFLIDEKGEPYLSRKVWGYSDGQQSYIMMDGGLFPAFRIDNAWYVWGSRDYRIKMHHAPVLLLFPGMWVLGGEAVGVTVSRKMIFFSMDIETGQMLY